MITTLLTVAYYGLVYLAWAMVVASAIMFALAFVKYMLWPNTTNYETQMNFLVGTDMTRENDDNV